MQFPIPLLLCYPCVGVRGVVLFIDRAAWRDNVDIGDTQLLKQLLDSNGFDSNRLLEEANTQPIKSMLFRNNARLAGMIGSCMCVCGRNVHYLSYNLLLYNL